MMERIRGIPYKWTALLTVSLGSFIATLDVSIVNISFPRLTRVFNTEPSVVLWVTLGYILVCSSLMLSVGRAGDMLGRKRFYTLGFVLFTLGLGLCSLSQTIAQLIMSRMVQGLGAAMTISLGAAIIGSAFPSNERGKALGIWGAVVYGGMVVGPVLGGFLLDTFGWKSIFITRLPFSLLGLALAWLLIKDQPEPKPGLKFDGWGAFTLAGSLSTLLIFFNFGGKTGFTSPLVIAMAVAALVFSSLFFVVEKRVAQPLVDLNLFRNRLFAGGMLSLGIIFLASAMNTFLMPFYLVDGLGRSASEAGMLTAAVALSTLVVAPFSGWLSDRLGPRLLCTVGVGLVSLAMFWLSRLDAGSTNADVLVRLAVLGFGTGLFQSPNSSSIIGSVSKERLGTASAMIPTVRQMGMSSGVAIAGAIFTSRQMSYANQLSAAGFDPAVLQRMALIGGFRDTLIVAAVLCSIAIVASLARGKQKPTW